MSSRRWLLVFGILIISFMLFVQVKHGSASNAQVLEMNAGWVNQEVVDNQAIQPPYYEGEVMTFSSTTMDRDYTIYVGLPRDYSVDQEYPVVYVLDGDFYTMLVWPISDFLSFDRQMPPVIVVGIGYGLDDPFDIFDVRIKDFAKNNQPNFQQFLKSELIPEIESKYSTKPNDRTIFGHSLTARLVHYSMFSDPDLFQRYIAVGASNYPDTRDEEIAYAENHDDLHIVLYMVFGSLEGGSVERTTLFNTLINRQYPGLKIEMDNIEGETHISVVPAAITKGLRSVFGE